MDKTYSKMSKIEFSDVLLKQTSSRGKGLESNKRREIYSRPTNIFSFIKILSNVYKTYLKYSTQYNCLSRRGDIEGSTCVSWVTFASFTFAFKQQVLK